jgi:hypothetical protein
MPRRRRLLVNRRVVRSFNVLAVPLALVVSVLRTRVVPVVGLAVPEALVAPVVLVHAVPCIRPAPSLADLLLVVPVHVLALRVLVDAPALAVLVVVLALADHAQVHLAL